MERADEADMDRVVVAIDGPSGSGKSSASRGAARRLDLRYLDTGAMYRALTWWMLRAGVPLDDAEKIAARCGEPQLEVETDPKAPRIAIDGVDVSRPVRSREVTNAVSAVASVPAVRARLIALQRELIGNGGIVVEGRDIGTTVAPDADVKVYLTAHEDIRARRRAAEGLAGSRVEVGRTRQEIARRDRLDSDQSGRASDAVVLDTTDLDLEQVIDRIAALAGERVGACGPR
ncbi:MAG: (d)CMP kinase [Actinopolymorphaceae bacterium]